MKFDLGMLHLDVKDVENATGDESSISYLRPGYYADCWIDLCCG